MILQVSVHPSRMSDLISWDGLQIDPPIPANTYHDSFGNFCHVIRAPAGRLTLSTDFLVHNSGELDEVVPGAEQLEGLPGGHFDLSSRQPLLRFRRSRSAASAR
jgi:hypothetical protein